jgi:nucleoside-diphosphate-sugar epimerase
VTTGRTAFVTGALGFIGGAIGDRLRADGWRVTGVDVRANAALGVVAGDISKPGAWQQAASDCELVIHTAAVVSNAVGFGEQWQVNVLGTRRAIDAAVAGGASRFVLFSSIRAFGDGGFPDGVDERWPVRPDGSPYVNTKVAAEQVALQAHAAGELSVTVIRPGDAYGPGSRPWVVLPLEAIRSGQFVLPARGRGIFSPIYVEDLVDGVLLAATKPEGAGQVFTLTDGAPVTTAEYFGHLARLAGKPAPRGLPTAVLVAATSAATLVARVRGATSEINPETMRYLAREGSYSIQRARELLGFEPKVTLAEGITRTERWLRDEGLIA